MKNSKKELKKFMSQIIPSDLTLKQIPETIQGAFLAGMERADEIYRESILEACKEVGMDANLFFRIVLKHQE